jgi:hypothetical protein
MEDDNIDHIDGDGEKIAPIFNMDEGGMNVVVNEAYRAGK